MKKIFLNSGIIILLMLFSIGLNAQVKGPMYKIIQTKDGKVAVVNMAMDNMGYWMNLAKQGIVPYNKESKGGQIIYKGTVIPSSITEFEDSPDVPIYDDATSTQSENSIVVDPNDNMHVLNSNNSTDWSGGSVGDLYGTSSFKTEDGGELWEGSEEGTGGGNYGDPAVGIDLNGRMYCGYIHSNSGQGVAYSADGGTTWTSVVCGTVSGGSMLDKNHLKVDVSPNSLYKNNVYSAWTDFDGIVSMNNICITRSTNGGLTYSAPVAISTAVNAGSHNQGVNIQTGPNGEVYVVWAIYDGWPEPETSLGFAKSNDGGATWLPSTRIISNIKGIRQDEPTAHRVNSFPSMAVDQNTGNIYVVWANYGVPGTNTGDWIKVYMIKSTDNGTTWSTPLAVSQGPASTGKYSYLPWIACDSETGNLGVVFYDNRNCTGMDVEAWVSISSDEGETWEDFRVSDVSFTTKAISGLADGYMGDYLGITMLGGMVYPVWSDDRSGNFRAYTSPFSLNMKAKPTEFNAELVNESNGTTDLIWSFTDTSTTFVKFYVYRDGDLIDSTLDTTYVDVLPSYGSHKYQVSAMHTDGESSKVSDYVFWGKAMISVSPESLSDTMETNQITQHFITVTNNGQIDLIFDLKTQMTNKKENLVYCTASGTGDEYISGVVFGDINNTNTGEDGYHDYTNLSTDVNTGETYDITITNGNIYASDDLGIWIDFNQDNDFEDADENVVCSVNDSANGTYQITISEDALPGPTTMRVRIKYSGDDCGSPCGETTWGEVEDYTVNVIGWIQSQVPTDTVNPGKTITIPVKFNSTDYVPGTYTAELHFYSNASNFDTVDVPVTMVVVGDMPLNANPMAIPEVICNGSSTTLYANAVGGSGNYTYSWSDGASYTSTDENPVVSPTTTTTYTLEVTDSNGTVNKQVTVTVIEQLTAPVVPSGNDTIGNDNIVAKFWTNGSPYAYSYEWAVSPAEAGTIYGTTDTAFFVPAENYTGVISITVRAVNDCGTSDWSEAFEVVVIEGEVSIPENNNEIEVEVYPNPTNGKFVLKYESDKEDYLNFEIYNSTGQRIYTELNKYSWSLNTVEIDISNQPNGVYFIKVTGNLINENIKIIKE